MKLMVLDGNSIINRAFYGIRILTTKDGIFTNAVYGFLMMLSKLLDEEKPEALCVCFDVHAPTFRHKKFAEYKAQRKPMPEELRPQIPLMKEVLTAMNVPFYALPGWEADDLIGTISKICAAEKTECVIVTGDRDSLQLVDENVRVKLVTTKMGKTGTTDYTPQKFFEEYRFPPKAIVDLKGLWGDTSDNIPGVPGIGEKNGKFLVEKFGGIDGVYAQIDAPEISPSLRKKLLEGREKAAISRDLATIQTDAPIEFSVEKNLRKEPDVPALYALFKKLEFQKLIEKWKLAPAVPERETNGLELFDFAEENAAKSVVPAEEISLFAEEILPFPNEKFLSEIEASGTIFVFVETSESDKILNFGIAAGALYSVVPADFERSFFEKIFSAKFRKITNNAKRILKFCLEEKFENFGGFSFDVSVAAYLLDPAKGVKNLHEKFAKISSAAAGTKILQTLFSQQESALEAAGLKKLFSEIEMPLCEILASMEFLGAKIDREKMENFCRECAEKSAKKAAEIFQLAGTEFNLNSPKQLGEILFEKLELPAQKKKKSGYSTDAEVLKSLRGMHPIIALLEEFRLFSKLKTIAEGFISALGNDGRIHTNFNMTGTATGRLSSSNPNLQNVPARTEIGSELRSFFVPEPGNVLIDADYSQIELRVLAAISGDEEMKNAFKNGDDIHAVTASRVFRVVPAEVTPQMRSRAKAVNFGIVYGIGQFSLAKTLGISREEAKNYIEAYLEKYSGVNAYMKKIVEEAKRTGFVSTILGRRRAVPELFEKNHNLVAFGERVARNAPIQGSAADIIKIAMVKVFSRLKTSFPRAKLLLQIHDELIVEAPKEIASEVAEILSEEMENAFQLGVPLVAEASIGENWLDAK